MLPVPNWPEALDPAIHKVPSVLRKALVLAPAAIALTPERTWIGTNRLVLVPSPKAPETLAPAAQTVPSALR